MTDSITAAMDDLQIATENYVSLLTRRIRAEMADDAFDALDRKNVLKAMCNDD